MRMLDLVVVGGYFAVMLGVGWRARRGSAEAYWVAERRYGTVPVAASLLATVFGASSTLGIIGLGYARGLTGAWWSLIGGIALIPFGLILAARVRRLEVYTLPDILRRVYGQRVAVAAAVVIALAWCGVVAAQIVAGAYLLGGLLDLSFQPALAVVATVFTLYTLWGGQISVIRTDSWQFGLFFGGLTVALILVVASGMAAGSVLGGSPAGALRFPVSPGFGWYELLVFYPLIVGLPYLVGPDIYSRVLCARDERAARNAALLAAVGVIPLSFVLAFLGLLIRAQFPGLAPDAAFPAAVTTLAPVGLRGLIAVGILGAVMSSADTTLISASTILSLNVVRPLTRMDSDAALRVTRMFVVLVGVVAWAVAAFQQGIIASLLLAYAVFVGGVAIPTLAGFWRERLGVTSRAAFWAVLVGGTTAILAQAGDGSWLRTILGARGAGFLETVLGPRFGSILPLILAALVLLVGSLRGSRQGVTGRAQQTFPGNTRGTST